MGVTIACGLEVPFGRHLAFHSPICDVKCTKRTSEAGQCLISMAYWERRIGLYIIER